MLPPAASSVPRVLVPVAAQAVADLALAELAMAERAALVESAQGDQLSVAEVVPARAAWAQAVPASAVRGAAAHRQAERGPVEAAEAALALVARRAAVALLDPVERTDQRVPEARTPQAAPMEWQVLADRVALGDRVEARLVLAV